LGNPVLQHYQIPVPVLLEGYLVGVLLWVGLGSVCGLYLKGLVRSRSTVLEQMSKFEPPHKPGGTGGTKLEILFHFFVENNNILDQFLNNEEAKYFNTQVCESH
jgi:hypothetical protein